MRKKEFRKHLRSLKTAKAKEEAKAERAKQVAQKAETLQQLIKQQKDNKKAACKEAVEKLYAEGGSPHSQRAKYPVNNRQSACWWEAKEGLHTFKRIGKVRHAQAR